MLGRGAHIESLYLDNFYCAFASGGAGEAPVAAFRCQPLRFVSGALGADRESPTLPRLLYADQKTYLVELLMKQDQMSMSCSLESRVPFLDHKFVEFAASRAGPHMKLRGKEGKYIIKKAVEDLHSAQHHLSQEDGVPHADYYMAIAGGSSPAARLPARPLMACSPVMSIWLT